MPTACVCASSGLVQLRFGSTTLATTYVELRRMYRKYYSAPTHLLSQSLSSKASASFTRITAIQTSPITTSGHRQEPASIALRSARPRGGLAIAADAGTAGWLAGGAVTEPRRLCGALTACSPLAHLREEVRTSSRLPRLSTAWLAAQTRCRVRSTLTFLAPVRRGVWHSAQAQAAEQTELECAVYGGG